MANNRPKSWKKIKESRKKSPDSVRCLLGYMLRASRDREFSFTMIDRQSGEEIPVVFNNGKTWVMENETDADTMLVWLSRYSKDFERLFYEAAQETVGKRELAMGFAVAKLADLSGKKDRPAKVAVSYGTSTHVVEITRSGKAPVYRIDGIQTGPEEAEQFIRNRYISFMVGYKAAVKALENGTENRQVMNISNAQPKTAAGKKILPVDIEARLGQAGAQGPGKTTKKWPKQLLGEQLLSHEMKGYVGVRKEGNDGKD